MSSHDPPLQTNEPAITALGEAKPNNEVFRLLARAMGLEAELFEESDEGGRGLGLLAGPVKRLEARRVPHMGWNTLAVQGAPSLLAGVAGEDVYFAHSYAAVPADTDVVAATVEHDGTVVAAVESGPLGGVQFHPERSAGPGARVLDNLLRWSRSV